MTNLWARESYTNVTKGYRYGEGWWHETFTDNTGELYRALVREHGRCVSKMYRDRDGGGPPLVCGWVFQKRDRYDDARSNAKSETYIRETWVEVSATEPRREWHNINSPFEESSHAVPQR